MVGFELKLVMCALHRPKAVGATVWQPFSLEGGDYQRIALVPSVPSCVDIIFGNNGQHSRIRAVSHTPQFAREQNKQKQFVGVCLSTKLHRTNCAVQIVPHNQTESTGRCAFEASELNFGPNKVGESQFEPHCLVLRLSIDFIPGQIPKRFGLEEPFLESSSCF